MASSSPRKSMLPMDGRENEIQDLEAEVEEQRHALRVAQEKLQHRLQFEREAEMSRLAEQKELLDAEVEHELKEKEELARLVAEMKKIEAAMRDEENEVTSRIEESQMRHDLEQIALLKIELEDFSNRRAGLDKIIWTNSLQVDSIEEERQARDSHNVSRLDKLLLKAERLHQELESGSYDERDRARIANAVLEPEQDKQGPFRLIDEVLSKRRQRLDEEVLESEELIKELNLKRREIEQDHVDLLERKRAHQLLANKGIDFLTEVHLGNTPPLEFLLRNAQVQLAANKRKRRPRAFLSQSEQNSGSIDGDDDGEANAEDEEEDEEEEDDEDAEDVVSSDIDVLRFEVTQGEKRLAEVKRQHQTSLHMAEDAPFVYKGEFSVKQFPERQRAAYMAVRSIVTDVILPHVFQTVSFLDVPPVEFLMDQLDVLQAHQQELGVLEEAHAHSAARLLVFSELIAEVVEEIVRDIYAELQRSAQLAFRLTSGICRSVVVDQSQYVLAQIKEREVATKTTKKAESESLTPAAAVVVEETFAEMKRERDRLRARDNNMQQELLTHVQADLFATDRQRFMTLLKGSDSSCVPRFCHMNPLVTHQSFLERQKTRDQWLAKVAENKKGIFSWKVKPLDESAGPQLKPAVQPGAAGVLQSRQLGMQQKAQDAADLELQQMADDALKGIVVLPLNAPEHGTVYPATLPTHVVNRGMEVLGREASQASDASADTASMSGDSDGNHALDGGSQSPRGAMERKYGSGNEQSQDDDLKRDAGGLPGQFESDLHRFAVQEIQYWRKMQIRTAQTFPVYREDRKSENNDLSAVSIEQHKLLLKQGRITCSAFSAQGDKLALCTDCGGIMVYDLRPLLLPDSAPVEVESFPNADAAAATRLTFPYSQATLVRCSKLPDEHPTSESPQMDTFVDNIIQQVSWDATGQQLTTVDHRGVLRLWNLRTHSHMTSSALPLLAPAHELDITPTNLYRAVNAEEPSDTSRRSLRATWGAFHPSFTLSGSNPSLVVAQSNGVVVKWNMHSPLSCISGPYPFLSLVPREPPCSARTRLKVNSDYSRKPYPTREFFVSKAHTTRLILVAFVSNSSCAFPLSKASSRVRTGQVLREYMVTVDEEGYVCVWCYSHGHFTSYGWFTPQNQYRVVPLHDDFRAVASVAEEEVLFSLDDAMRAHGAAHLAEDMSSGVPLLNLKAVQQMMSADADSRAHVVSKYLASLPPQGLEFPHWKEEKLDGGRMRYSYLERGARRLLPSNSAKGARTDSHPDPARKGDERSIQADVRVKMHHFLYDRAGILLKHSLSSASKNTLRGQVLQAELTSSKSDLILLTRFSVPIGSDHDIRPTHSLSSSPLPRDRNTARSFVELRMLSLDKSFAPPPVARAPPPSAFLEQGFSAASEPQQASPNLQHETSGSSAGRDAPVGAARPRGTYGRKVRSGGSFSARRKEISTDLTQRATAPSVDSAQLSERHTTHREKRKQVWYLDRRDFQERSNSSSVREDVSQRDQYESEVEQRLSVEQSTTGAVPLGPPTMGAAELTSFLVRVEVHEDEDVTMQCSPALDCPGSDYVYLFASRPSPKGGQSMRCMVFSLTTANQVASFDVPVSLGSFGDAPLQVRLCPRHRFLCITPRVTHDPDWAERLLAERMAAKKKRHPTTGSLLLRIEDVNTAEDRRVFIDLSNRALPHRIGPLSRPRYPVETRIRSSLMAVGTIPRVPFEFQKPWRQRRGEEQLQPAASSQDMDNHLPDARKQIQTFVRQLVARSANLAEKARRK